jgi:hypothetical protein
MVFGDDGLWRTPQCREREMEDANDKEIDRTTGPCISRL